MREDYTVNHRGKFLEVDGLLQSLNESLRKIGQRFDKMDGTRGTPTFSGNVNLDGNRLTNVSEPANNRDAVNLSFADENYIRRDSRFAQSIVTAPVSNQAVDNGRIVFTGSTSFATRLVNVTSVSACLGQDASIDLYPSITVTVSGTTITFKAWKPTSASDPTPIPATTSSIVYWMAIGGLP